MKTLIIQTSPTRTASTILVNAIYGLIPELSNKKIIYNNKLLTINENDFEQIIVIKTHNTDIDDLINKYDKTYKLVFICSQRKELKRFINEKYKTYKNVVIFEFDELNETKDNTITHIVDNIYNKINVILPDIVLNKKKGIERINLMNNRYEEIKEKDFNFVDPFFHIHGSHRNRANTKTVIVPKRL